MNEIKNKERFAEIERVLDDYFDLHIAPVMRDTEEYLQKKQLEEMAEYSRSPAGILSTMASAQNPMLDPYQTLKLTGEWNSKTTEDYIAMCNDKVTGNEDFQEDLAMLANEWRSTVVSEVGRERYDELSSNLGGDLAYAYIQYRIEQMMIDRLVKDSMPKSSAEYIMRKAAQNSLLGLASTLNQSPLAAEIEQRGEAAYKPSKAEKGAGWAIGAGMDAISFGGIGSWGAFARFVGFDLAINAIASPNEKDKPLSVENCISKGVFGSDINVFADFRKQADKISKEQNEYIIATNERLSQKIDIPTYDFSEWMTKNSPNMFSKFTQSVQNQKERYKDVPKVIAPGYEEAYLKGLEQRTAEKERKRYDVFKSSGTKSPTDESSAPAESTVSEQQDSNVVQYHEEREVQQTNENGWEGFVSALGLGDFGAVTKNLGYVFSMLPDILLGIFTGKTKSLNIGDNLIPIASIVAGAFIKNPILKMLMIGFGGANLLNKAGHEVLDWQQNNANNSKSKENIRYRIYQEEALNPRISNPILQGGNLIAVIDRIPCTIQLPEKVIAAYNAGALPLNTLANAILAKCDQTQQLAEMNYENNDRETIIRTRGIQ
jgi:hypothetical protein